MQLSKSIIEHKKRIWDTVSLKSNCDILLTGVGVYTPTGSEALICVDARPLEEPLRPLDVETKLDCIEDDSNTITIFSKVCITHKEKYYKFQVKYYVMKLLGS